MPQHVYLDSAVLVPLLVDVEMRDQESWAHSIIGRIDGQSNSHNISAKIPQVCLGEVVNRYYHHYGEGDVPSSYHPPRDTFLDSLFGILDRVNGELVSTDTRAQKFATTLERRNSRISNQDALVAGTAIDDPHSTRLITTDEYLIGSPEIGELCNDQTHRVHNLTVSDTY